jgi:hypothetical protein
MVGVIITGLINKVLERIDITAGYFIMGDAV